MGSVAWASNEIVGVKVAEGVGFEPIDRRFIQIHLGCIRVHNYGLFLHLTDYPVRLGI